jgi:hypothetical protein
MVFLLLVVFGFSTKPLTMIRLFAELSGHYPNCRRVTVPAAALRRSFRAKGVTEEGMAIVEMHTLRRSGSNPLSAYFCSR